MQIFKIVLLALLATGLHAKGVKWQKLKSLKEYSGSAYTLKKGVEYLEIREYFVYLNPKKDIKKYTISASMYRTPLKFFDPKMVKKFRNLTPNISAQTNIRRWGRSMSNGFFIDDHGKMWRMNTKEDIIEMLGEIDTPVEAKIILWLNDKHRTLTDNNHKDKYHKTSNGYTIIAEYNNNMGITSSFTVFTHRIKIDKKGKIIEYKLLKKKTEACLHPSPPMFEEK